MENKFNDETFLARWLNGALDEEELVEFSKHPDFEVYQKIAKQSSELQMPPRDKAKAWEQFQELAKAPELATKSAKTRGLGTWWKYATAASILVLLGFFAWFNFADQSQSVVVPLASQESVVLPDGSEVLLNAASTLQWNASPFSEKRQLYLEGEAFFKVKKGADFIVDTQNGHVRVIGTSFNVSARAQHLEVACYSGQVGVYFDDANQMQLLSKGNGLRAQARQVSHNFLIDSLQTSPTWLRGEARFINADLTEVIAELERQYAVQISYPTELDAIQNYNGGFPHHNLNTALKVVFSSVGYQHQINGKQINVFK